MKAIVLSLVLASLAGCSLITPKVGPQVAKAVNRYCAEAYQTRLLMRTEVNAMIKPNTVKVTCEGDPE
jgi:uncharacterized protein YceK